MIDAAINTHPALIDRMAQRGAVLGVPLGEYAKRARKAIRAAKRTCGYRPSRYVKKICILGAITASNPFLLLDAIGTRRACLRVEYCL